MIEDAAKEFLRSLTEDQRAAAKRPFDDETERRRIVPHVARTWRRNDIDEMVRYSPLIEVTFDSSIPRSDG